MTTLAKERTRFRRRLRHDQTEAERRPWHRLRDRRLAGFKFVRQESVGPYVADFCCREARLIVECDGSQHADSESDSVRDAWLTERGYRILRFWNPEIMTNIDGVSDTILAALLPSPRTRGEGCDDLVVGAASPKGDGEGMSTKEPVPDTSPHPRSARLAPDKGGSALSPRAGRGGSRI
ncbi:endonuclease domain-containing protein [Methylobacterium organophilum]|uniref:endonuclease domain-containing protein n=1 Tax=Methylobacterium organophilum TaxID=410 RepID=UPI003083F28E